MNKPVVIVIAGPNGSGKTSTTRIVIKYEWSKQCVYINPDEVAQTKFGDWNDTNAIRRLLPLVAGFLPEPLALKNFCQDDYSMYLCLLKMYLYGNNYTGI